AMEFRDLETAGGYLVIAATLIYLKSKLLVPPDETVAEVLDEEGESLRLELEERLREYARVKALGGKLAEREAEQALVWGRPSSTLPAPEDVPLEDLSVHLLERTVRGLIEEQLRRWPREVEANPPSILERMAEILGLLRDTWWLLFSSLTGGERRRAQIVVTLLAVLELVRLGRDLMLVPGRVGYRRVMRAGVAPWLVKLARARTMQQLSLTALDALACVAYTQSVLRREVDAIRGVTSDAVLENLLERRLIRI